MAKSRKPRAQKPAAPSAVVTEVVVSRIVPHTVEIPAPAPEEAPAPRARRTIVPKSYQDAYGRKGHCGDWLAYQLEGFGRDKDGKIVFEEWEKLFSDNGVDLTKPWANAKRTAGWQGRYRMSGRLQLEKQVLRTGALVNADETVTDAPDSWLREMATKHPKVECEWAD